MKFKLLHPVFLLMKEYQPDVLAVTGASIATLLGEIPFYGPMAAVRVGLIGDDFILIPAIERLRKVI